MPHTPTHKPTPTPTPSPTGVDIYSAIKALEAQRTAAGVSTQTVTLDPELAGAMGQSGNQADWMVFGLNPVIANVRFRVGTQESTLGKELARFYTMRPEMRTLIQRGLWATGMYSARYYSARNPRAPVWGEPDEDSYEAFQQVLFRAARKQVAERILSQGDGQQLPKELVSPSLGPPTVSPPGGN